jgi:hypothetical protein
MSKEGAAFWNMPEGNWKPRAEGWNIGSFIGFVTLS